MENAPSIVSQIVGLIVVKVNEELENDPAKGVVLIEVTEESTGGKYYINGGPGFVGSDLDLIVESLKDKGFSAKYKDGLFVVSRSFSVKV